MFEHILIPTDGSVLSEEVIKQGICLAASIQAPGHRFSRDSEIPCLRPDHGIAGSEPRRLCPSRTHVCRHPA